MFGLSLGVIDMATAKEPQCYYEDFPIKRILLGNGDFIAMKYNHDGNQPEYKNEYDVANNVYRLGSNFEMRWQVHRDDWNHIERILFLRPERGSIGHFGSLHVEDINGILKVSDSSWDTSPPLLLMPGEKVVLRDRPTGRLFDVDLETGHATGRPVPPNSRIW